MPEIGGREEKLLLAVLDPSFLPSLINTDFEEEEEEEEEGELGKKICTERRVMATSTQNNGVRVAAGEGFIPLAE